MFGIKKKIPDGLKKGNYFILKAQKGAKKSRKKKQKAATLYENQEITLLYSATHLKIGGLQACWGLTDHIQSMYKVNMLSPEIKWSDSN